MPHIVVGVDGVEADATHSLTTQAKLESASVPLEKASSNILDAAKLTLKRSWAW